MKFESEGTSEVTKYNPRRELHGDEGVMAGDINITSNLPVEVLNQLAVDKFDFGKTLYNTSGELKALCFDTLNFFREFENMRVELKLDEESDPIIIANANMKKFTAKLLPGFRTDLSYQVQLHPNEEESGELHVAMLKTGISLNVQNGSGQKDIEDETE